jgi:hypothetical protein
MRTLLIMAVLVIPGLAQAQADELYGPPAPPPAPPKPEIFVPQPEKNAGDIFAGEDIDETFEVANRGPGVLNVQNVRTSCGCQTVRFDKTIPPNGKGEVVMKVRTRGYSGSVRKSATIESDDPKQPKITVTVTANIKTLMKFEPAYPVLEGLRGEELATTVKLRRDIPGTLEIVSVTPQQGTAPVVHELKEVKPGEEFELAIKVKTTASTQSEYGPPVVLNIKAKVGEKVLDVPLSVRMKLVDTINVTPSKYVVFRRPEIETFLAQGGSAPVKTVTLTGWGGRTFNVTSTEVKARKLTPTGSDFQLLPDPPVAVKVEAGQNKSAYALEVSLAKINEENQRTTTCEIIIHTDDALTPEITLRTTLYFPGAGGVNLPAFGTGSTMSPPTIRGPSAGVTPPKVGPPSLPPAPPRQGVTTTPPPPIPHAPPSSTK